MSEIAGIKYTKDKNGRKRYVRVDLDLHGENQLIEDFLDLLEIEARKDDETISLDEFNKYIDERLKANV
ncbi:MAG: hypothetical protein LBR97_10465 [Dysgonamonadaceae bacterium]|jgi:hypothetical protein|nr:hypothetical protein [Dysgonamonadaceae bacterium]